MLSRLAHQDIAKIRKLSVASGNTCELKVRLSEYFRCDDYARFWVWQRFAVLTEEIAAEQLLCNLTPDRRIASVLVLQIFLPKVGGRGTFQLKAVVNRLALQIRPSIGQGLSILRESVKIVGGVFLQLPKD